MDVVPANPKEWQVPPFSGEVKDGDIWGRGAIDDKGPGVIELMAMLAIKRAGILLNRDVIFIATGDEEEGGQQRRRMVRRAREAGLCRRRLTCSMRVAESSRRPAASFLGGLADRKDADVDPADGRAGRPAMPRCRPTKPRSRI